MEEITIAAQGKVRAKFFKGDDDGRDYVEISAIGDPCTVIHKVLPEHVQRFPVDWTAYQKGAAEVHVEGTPLIEVPGIDKNVALALRLKGIRVAEELAVLDEAAAKSLGMGGLSIWKAAQNLIKLKQLEAQAAMVSDHQALKRARKADEAATA